MPGFGITAEGITVLAMRTVLFICTGNYYRSRFAEAVFNCEADRRGLKWQAISRGLALNPAHGNLSRHTGTALDVRGIDRRHTAANRMAMAAEAFAQADRVIALDRTEHYPIMLRRFAVWADRIDYWDVADVQFRQPDEALPEIEVQVWGLLETLIAEG